MDRILYVCLLVGLQCCCYAQSTTKGPAPTPKPLPAERGIILSTYPDYADPDAAQLRHIPFYPGFENFSGSVPGVGFTNENIQFLSLDVDFRSKCVYMYDFHLRSIVIGCGYNKDLDIANMTFDFMHVGVSRGTVQLAYDWLSQTLYWTDSVYRTVVAAPGKKGMMEKDYYKIIADQHLDAPDGLAVDPFEGLLFWSDNGKHPKIERASTSGANRHTIIQKNLISPLSMEVDHFEKRLFWIDSYTEAILSSNYDGEQITQIQRITSSDLFDIGIFRDCVYVTDIRNSDFITLNKTIGPHLGKQESTTINIYPETIYGIAVYGAESQPLNNTDFCAEKNCEHMCASTKTGAECMCSEGYRLDQNGKCLETTKNFHKAIVTVNATHICLVDIRSFAHVNYDVECKYTAIKQPRTTPSPSALSTTPASASSNASTSPNQTTTPRATIPTTPAPTAAPGDRIKLVDMDMEKRMFYFVTENNIIYQRPIDIPIENDAKDPIAYPTGNVSGISFDAVNKNILYWSESDTGQIMAVDLATSAVVKVNEENMDFSNVRDVTVLAEQRLLAMITGQEGAMSIQTMSFTGVVTSPPVIKDVSNIASFAYDREKQKFYYISGSYVYSISRDGTNRKTEFIGVDAGAFELVLYKNYLTWLFASGQYKHLVRTYDVTTKRAVALGYFDNSTIVDMKVLDVSLQKLNVISPCAYENGNCAQICVTEYQNGKMKKVCECKLGYSLGNDQTSCVSAPVEDNFLLVTDWTNEEIMQINLDTNEVHSLPSADSDEFMGVYFDSDTKRVIWALYYGSEIYSSNINGSDRKVITDLGFEGYAYRFDKDKTSKNLYFSCYYDSFIGVLTASGYFIRFDYDFGYDDIGDIVVHPGKGLLYFTVTGYSESYIGRADMDGSNVVKLISGDQIDYPDGLAIDFIHNHLYWSDATYDTIQQCDLTGKNCRTVINMTGTYRDEQIRDLVTDGTYLYYSTYKKDHVVRVDLSTFDRTIVGQNPGLGKLDSMTFYSSKDKNIQPVGSACQARNGLGDCSTICFPTPAGRTCSCQPGISVKSDGRTCSDIYQCDDLLMQPAAINSGDMNALKITIDEACLRHLNDECNYQCPVNYVPIFDGPLKCTNVGWDKDPEITHLCRANPERRCPPKIQNGALDNSCKREIGEKCSFSCNSGFNKSREFAVCTNDEKYHPPDEQLCEPIMCSETIPNGVLTSNCQRTIGSSCEYKCSNFFSPIDKKAQTKCTTNGWSPADNSLCKESVCDDTSLSNGKVTGTCSKKIGEACMYQCNQGYVNTTYQAVCKNDRMWHPAVSCRVAKCPSTIPNGKILTPCDFAIGTNCSFVCGDGFKRSDLHTNVMCGSSALWDLKGSVCLEVAVTPQKQVQAASLSTPGVAVGIVVLILIIIALVVLLVILYRRNMGKLASNYASASFHNGSGGSNIAIENPGYIPSNGPPVSDKDEHPYSSVDPSQMQPVTFAGGEAAGDGGMVNPMYNKEPLPDVGHVEMDQDKTVLTYESWRKERENANGKY